MLTTSTLYNQLIASSNHRFQTKITINSVDYGEDKILSATADYRVFTENQPVVGGCLAAELEVEMIAPSASIPRMAQVRPYVRVTDGTQTSEWLPQGIFYIDTRKTTHNDDGLDILTLHCYDAMLKTEADYPSSTSSWPKSDINVVKEIAYKIGLQSSASATTGIDSRTITLMNKAYQIGLPVGYSMRETLSYIAAMYAGNWIMTYEGKLRLVTLTELPDETYYLIDEHFDAITFGGDRILV